MERIIKLINKANNEILCEILANHSMTIDEAIEFIPGLENLKKDDCTDPDYMVNGEEIWYDDIEMVVEF